MDCSNTRRLAGSVDVEGALKPSEPNAALWDYVVGLSAQGGTDEAVWVEVHPASSQHVDEVLQKLDWLLRWLKERKAPVRNLRRRFCWVATGKVAFTPASPQGKRIAERGLQFPSKFLWLDMCRESA